MRNKQFGGRGGDGGGKRGSRKHHKVEGEDEDDYEEGLLCAIKRILKTENSCKLCVIIFSSIGLFGVCT